MDLIVAIYGATSSLPKTERFGLSTQMRRCAVSIASNISEGFGRFSTREYIRFLRMARGSVAELATQIEICARLDYDGPWMDLHASTDEISRMLQGLQKSLRRHLLRREKH